ncbi:MAG: glycosyltransferase family 4 protein, partial [Candidatus Pacebacteria bacterium]|nr:glycosyltransferase family 4 protein [Candidatus Paceibacterota bacterium]
FKTKGFVFGVYMPLWLHSGAPRPPALLVVPSNYLRGIVAQWGVRPERLMRIYLGIDFSEEPIMPTDVPDGKILFTLGRLVPWKGFAMLIDLMHELPKEWHLVIAGDGPLRGELEKQADAIGIADRITFTGALPRAEILGWYRAADAFALNTSFESFSFQVLEAMASGTPVIATNIGSLPELITNGVEGVLCTPNDSEAFKEAILSTQSEAGAWQTQTDDAVRKARGFSVETSVHAFADAVTKLCG